MRIVNKFGGSFDEELRICLLRARPCAGKTSGRHVQQMCFMLALAKHYFCIIKSSIT